MIIAWWSLLAEGWDWTRDQLQAEARQALIDLGNDPWDVDNVIPQFIYDRALWSNTFPGIVHDCAGHLPEETDPSTCFSDARPVSLVSNIPPVMLGYPDNGFAGE